MPDSRGRGGFTGNAQDDYKFKIPSLYNLADAGFTFMALPSPRTRCCRYKNAAVSQKAIASDHLDSRFQPLGLSAQEIDDLTVFLETGLYDAELERYVPTALPSGNCFPNADSASLEDLDC